MNAIERLRKQPILHYTYEQLEAHHAALAAVDALYQAAKALNENRTRPINREWNALAAAVRRVDGEA